MGNPLAAISFFLGLIASVVSAYFVHNFLYHHLKKNWLAFLLSLLGLIPLAFLLSILGKLLILRMIPGPMSLGEGLGAGIGMALIYGLFIMVGLALYILTIIVMTVYHWTKKK